MVATWPSKRVDFSVLRRTGSATMSKECGMQREGECTVQLKEKKNVGVFKQKANKINSGSKNEPHNLGEPSATLHSHWDHVAVI